MSSRMESYREGKLISNVLHDIVRYIRVVSGFPNELEDGHQEGERKSTQKDHKDTTHVVYAEIVDRRRFLGLLRAPATSFLLHPPALLQLQENSILVQL